MSKWDARDARLARAVGDLLRDPIWWQPMAGQGATRERINRKWERDTTRAGMWVRDAISTFRTNVVDAGAPGVDVTDRGSVIGFDLVVDVNPADFPIVGGAYSLPVTGDVFYLQKEFEGNQFFQVERDTNDGSARLLYMCQTPRQRITTDDLDPNRGEP